MFLGASYFRALGKGQVYGLSARGLAVDTAAPRRRGVSALHRVLDRAPEARRQHVDDLRAARVARASPAPTVRRAAGHRHRDARCTARMFLRAARSRKLGIAPLTSMFTSARTSPAATTTAPRCTTPTACRCRPAPASGSGARWSIRSGCSSPRSAPTNPRGFGLMQRDRAFANYEDPEARYERRPSVWVEPIGGWGPGRVELVQIPTPDETNDNIVAYWVPNKPLAAGKPIELGYRMRWQMQRAGCRRQGLGGADAARPRLREEAGRRASISSSTSTVRCCVRSARSRSSSAVVSVDAQRRVARTQPLSATRSAARWRMTVRVQARRRLQAGRDARLLAARTASRSARPGATSCRPNRRSHDARVSSTGRTHRSVAHRVADAGRFLPSDRRREAAMSQRPVPQPPYARASMHFEAWAGHPLARTGRRLIGRGGPRRMRAAHDTRR